MTVSIEPTTACNLRCPECPSGLRAFTRETGNLKADFSKDDRYVGTGSALSHFLFPGRTLYQSAFPGDGPLCAPEKLYTITSTNGHFLDDARARATVESGLDRLIISVDGTTQETYASYRIDGQLEKVLEGASNVVRWKRPLGPRHRILYSIPGRST